jgi:hypothetical protein
MYGKGVEPVSWMGVRSPDDRAPREHSDRLGARLVDRKTVEIG